MTAAVALLAFSAVPSFADHHGGGSGGWHGGGGWHDIDHLHRRELLDDAARGEPRRQCMQPPRQSGVQAIGQEGDEDMRFDPGLVLMEDRPDGEIALKVLEGFFDADEQQVQIPQLGWPP